MRGKIIATKLNIRDRPDANSSRVGILGANSVVDILGENDGWYEIKYKNRHAYAASHYIQPIKHLLSLKGIVKPNKLNVRNRPSIAGSIIGQVSRNVLVSITAEHDKWLEIAFNQNSGFIAKSYVDLIDSGAMVQGVVTAGKLNVRNKPNSDSDVIGSLSYKSPVTIRGTIGKWYEIVFNGLAAYISANYVEKQEPDSQQTPFAPQLEDQESETELDLNSIELSPVNKLDVSYSGKEEKVALTWNKYGRLLETLSKRCRVDKACAVAVLCVESSGDGFRQDNQNRQVIRFENHKFWKFWGKNNADVFNQHFKFNASGKPWLGHKWRHAPDEDWGGFHGNQVSEWKVLDFARTLDNSAALLSISMGAPQIMGFHYKKLDYETVEDMFKKFSSDIRYQILGFFDFLSPSMLDALRDKDFTTFAKYYNGSGQMEKYGRWIQEYYNAFEKIAG